MNLLIVDDAMSVVDGLRENVDWSSVGISRTFGAYSAFEAKLVLQEYPIDILLSDIEMPIEDGISLVTWVQEKKLEPAVIMLTAHADFRYAHQAVKMGVFDYILQPAAYHDIAAVVERAVQKRRQDALEQKIQLYGQRYLDNEESIISSLLWDWLTGMGRKADVEHYASVGKLPSQTTPVCIGLMHPIAWKQEQHWDRRLCLYAMQDMMDKLIQPIGCRGIVLSGGINDFLFVGWPEGQIPEQQLVERQVELFTVSCRQYFGFEVALYYACIDAACELPAGWGQISAAQQNNVADTPGIYPVGQEDIRERFVLNQKYVQEWIMQLTGAHPERMKQSANELLDQLIAGRKMNAGTLQDFYHEFLNILSQAVPADHSLWKQLEQDPRYAGLRHNGQYVLEDMRKLIELVVEHLKSGLTESNPELIRQVDDYIDHHMEDIIHRSELAQALYLHPDYLNRIFKQETGKTIKEYIIERKMEMARRLLTTTNLPVNLIAARVGFGQLSHFSATYKKVFDRTPIQERKEAGK